MKKALRFALVIGLIAGVALSVLALSFTLALFPVLRGFVSWAIIGASVAMLAASIFHKLLNKQG